MTIIVYKCDVCDRETELLQNKKGLEVIQRCTITDNCRGKLYQLGVKQDHIRGQFPSAVGGLDDWTPRKMIYNHTQSIRQQEWRVNHELGIFPTIHVFVERPVAGSTEALSDVPCIARGGQDETETTDLIKLNPDEFVVNIIDDNSFDIVLVNPEKGKVQCVARSAAPDKKKAAVVDPTDDATWTTAKVNALEFGLVINSKV